MTRDTSLTFREAAFAPETGEALLVLITLDHDDFSTPFRFTSDKVDTVSNGNTYTSFPFEITLPNDDEGIATAKITIDNVSREIIDEMRTITSPIDVMIEIVLGSDPDTVEAEFSGFELLKGNYTPLVITGTLGIETFMREPVCGDIISPARFPGIF